MRFLHGVSYYVDAGSEIRLFAMATQFGGPNGKTSAASREARRFLERSIPIRLLGQPKQAHLFIGSLRSVGEDWDKIESMVPESPQEESPLLCAWRQRSGVSPFIQRLATVLFPKPGFHISKMV